MMFWITFRSLSHLHQRDSPQYNYQNVQIFIIMLNTNSFLLINYNLQNWQRNKYRFDEWILALHVLPHIINFFHREWCFFPYGVCLAIFFFVLRHFYAHLLKTCSYLSNIEPRPIYHYRIYIPSYTP